MVEHALGRRVDHDPQSLAFAAAMAPKLVSVRHQRRVPTFDQGGLGSCTGQAAVGCISTAPFGHNGTQEEAVEVYKDATVIDEFPGQYPPTDTGSSGLAVMKALRNRGLISSYTHAFGFTEAMRALVLRPGITGFSWLAGCDRPNSKGVVRYTGRSRGGHEVVLEGLDVKKKLVWFRNSWGGGWGKAGTFAMSFADYTKALRNRGDATFPN